MNLTAVVTTKKVTPRDVLERRFWAKVDKGAPGGCWQWTGNILRSGYGQVRQNTVAYAVHRVAYEWLVGPIPDGLVIDHLCENRACVNPAHLEPVTQSDNSQRNTGKRTTCPHGHPLDGLSRVDVSKGRPRLRRYCSTCEARRQKIRAWRRMYATDAAVYVAMRAAVESQAPRDGFVSIHEIRQYHAGPLAKQRLNGMARRGLITHDRETARWAVTQLGLRHSFDPRLVP